MFAVVARLPQLNAPLEARVEQVKERAMPKRRSGLHGIAQCLVARKTSAKDLKVSQRFRGSVALYKGAKSFLFGTLHGILRNWTASPFAIISTKTQRYSVFRL
jgi:hypothetical protein